MKINLLRYSLFREREGKDSLARTRMLDEFTRAKTLYLSKCPSYHVREETKFVRTMMRLKGETKIETRLTYLHLSGCLRALSVYFYLLLTLWTHLCSTKLVSRVHATL